MIEKHIENCLAKSQGVLGVEETPTKRPRLDIPFDESSVSPVKSTLPSSLSSLTPEKPSETSVKKEGASNSPSTTPTRKVRNERKPLAERLRPSEFSELVVSTSLYF